MTKTQAKEIARSELMHAAVVAFNRIDDDICGEGWTDADKAMITAEADKQLKRVEDIFGFVPGSWPRGL